MLALLLVGLVVGWSAGAAKLLDPFLLFRLARAEAWEQGGRLVDYDLTVSVFDPLRPVYEFLLSALTTFTSLGPLEIALLPIGAVLMPLAFYASASQTVGDRPTAFALAVALMVSHAFATVHAGTFIYVWANILLFGFVLVLWLLLVRGRSPWLLATAITVFFITEALYPTTAMWMLILTVATGPVLVVMNRIHPVARPRGFILSAAAGAMLVYLTYFDRAFLGNVLPAIAVGGDSGGITSVVEEVVRRLGTIFPGLGFQVPRSPYETASISTPVGVVVVIAQYALLAAAALVAAGLSVRAMRHRNWSDVAQMRWALGAVLLLGAAGHIVAYALYGHVSLRSAILLGPVALAAILMAVGVSTLWTRVWAASLAVVSAVGFGAVVAAQPPPLHQEDVRPAATWLLNDSEVPRVTADLGLYGRMLVVAANDGRKLELVPMSDCVFAWLVEGKTCSEAPTSLFVALDKERPRVPIRSLGWREYGPPAAYWDQIQENSAGEVTFEDETVVIIRLDADAASGASESPP